MENPYQQHARMLASSGLHRPMGGRGYLSARRRPCLRRPAVVALLKRIRIVFIVSGEALMDVFVGASTPTGVGMDARIGGSPLNVAIGLARLGQPVAFLGGVSKGQLGERLLEAMRAENVGLDCVELLAAPTTLSLIGLDAQGVPDYAFYGEGAADRCLSLGALDKVPAGASVFQFGSYAMVIPGTGDTQRALVEREHTRSLISYDPNVRLNVEPDKAVWRATLDWMLPRTHLLKISDEDLHLLYPGASMEALAKEWLQKGPSLVVITRGGEGSLVWTANTHFAMPGRSITLVDTVGAGDTFTAAMLTRLAEKGLATPAGLTSLTEPDLREVIDFATRAAAITCSRRGADLPRRAEV